MDWGEDVSEDAVKQRLDEISGAARSMTLSDDLEKTQSERVNIFYDFVKVSASLYCSRMDVRLVTYAVLYCAQPYTTKQCKREQRASFKQRHIGVLVRSARRDWTTRWRRRSWARPSVWTSRTRRRSSSASCSTITTSSARSSSTVTSSCGSAQACNCLPFESSYCRRGGGATVVF